MIEKFHPYRCWRLRTIKKGNALTLSIEINWQVNKIKRKQSLNDIKFKPWLHFEHLEDLQTQQKHSKHQQHPAWINCYFSHCERYMPIYRGEDRRFTLRFLTKTPSGLILPKCLNSSSISAAVTSEGKFLT